MDQPAINEQVYPIQPVWILSTILKTIIVNILVFLFVLGIILLEPSNSTRFYGNMIVYVVWSLLALLIHFFYMVLTRANYHYSFDDSLLIIRYGILSKKNRNLPYGIIQNITVKQGLADRIFGLATLKIENAASAGSQAPYVSGAFAEKMSAQQDVMGSYGNLISIPGLKQEHAEYFKNILYEKIKSQPVIERGL